MTLNCLPLTQVRVPIVRVTSSSGAAGFGRARGQVATGGKISTHPVVLYV